MREIAGDREGEEVLLGLGQMVGLKGGEAAVYAEMTRAERVR